MSAAEILVELDNSIATITLHRPEQRNALTPAMWGTLASTIGELEGDVAVSAMVLTGADPAFCAGFDLRALAEEDRASRTTRLESRSSFAGMLPPHAKPLIGAINGAAMTGGFELALACDVLVGSDRARFADTHGRVGVLPGGGMTVLLPARIGHARARLLSTSAMPIDATTAYAWGLLDLLVDHDEVVIRAVSVARSIAAISKAVRDEILALYDQARGAPIEAALWAEQARAKQWMRDSFDLGGLADRRDDIVRDGRAKP